MCLKNGSLEKSHHQRDCASRGSRFPERLVRHEYVFIRLHQTVLNKLRADLSLGNICLSFHCTQCCCAPIVIIIIANISYYSGLYKMPKRCIFYFTLLTFLLPLVYFDPFPAKIHYKYIVFPHCQNIKTQTSHKSFFKTTV